MLVKIDHIDIKDTLVVGGLVGMLFAIVIGSMLLVFNAFLWVQIGSTGFPSLLTSGCIVFPGGVFLATLFGGLFAGSVAVFFNFCTAVFRVGIRVRMRRVDDRGQHLQ